MFFVSDEGKLFDESHNEIHPYITNDGYVWYSFKINNKRKSIFLHRLVYKLFCGDMPKGMHIHHKDKNPLNNSLVNLELKEAKQHLREHAQKYFDKEVVCPVCGKLFIWTAKQQAMHFSNLSRIGRRILKQPLCSKHCVGIFGQRQQMKKYSQEQIRKSSREGQIFPSKYSNVSLNVFKENEIKFKNIPYDEFSLYLQNNFLLDRYRANDLINRCLKGKRKSCHGFVIIKSENNKDIV